MKEGPQVYLRSYISTTKMEFLIFHIHLKNCMVTWSQSRSVNNKDILLRLQKSFKLKVSNKNYCVGFNTLLYNNLVIAGAITDIL